MGHANAQESPTFASTGSGADPFAIMKEIGHTNIKTTMIYVSLGKSHIRDQVEKLNAIPLLPPPA